MNRYDLDGSGTIDMWELKKMFAAVGRHLTDTELYRIMSEGKHRDGG